LVAPRELSKEIEDLPRTMLLLDPRDQRRCEVGLLSLEAETRDRASRASAAAPPIPREIAGNPVEPWHYRVSLEDDTLSLSPRDEKCLGHKFLSGIPVTGYAETEVVNGPVVPIEDQPKRICISSDSVCPQLTI
jgi:hypothetical protein